MNKLKSRKFWTALIGFAAGLFLVLSGNSMEGAATLIASILGYLAAEGWIDGKSVQAGQALGELIKETKADGNSKQNTKSSR